MHLDEIDEVEYYIAKFYSRNEIPKELIVPEELNAEDLKTILNTNVITPKKGVKKDLLKMAYDNAKLNLDNKFEEIERDETRTIKANEELAELLNMDSIYRIDIFDNSNLFGDFSVSGMVVFIDGKPAKNEYRKFKVSFEKNDDYNTMREIMYRRYQKALVERSNLPDLIIVDGGEKQITAAKEILDLLHANIRIVGLKKNDKHRTNELIDTDLTPIPLDRTSNVFHYLTRMQDEVHRFTINYHRTLRSKGSIGSILDNINGIGTSRKKALIKKFGSVSKMQEASIEELNEILPLNVATELKNYLIEREKNKKEQ